MKVEERKKEKKGEGRRVEEGKEEGTDQNCHSYMSRPVTWWNSPPHMGRQCAFGNS